MKFNRKSTLFVLIIILVFATSCGREHSNPLDPNYQGPATMRKETRSGILEITQGSTLQENDLEVITFSTSSDIDQDGSFSVEANEAERFQILFFTSRTSNNPVYLGLYNPSTNKVTANDTSTALALTLFNPYLIYTTQLQREEYLRAVKKNEKFAQLLSLLRNAYRNDANTALDYNTNPAIYEIAAELMKDTMENLGENAALRKSSVDSSDPPYIEDAAGANINFINPRHIWYAGGIYLNEENLRDVISIERTETIVSLQLGWPPFITTKPTITEHHLGDGYFKIYLTKQLDFGKITQWNDPVGRSTILNSGQLIVYVVDLIIGVLPPINLFELPNHLSISIQRAYLLSKALDDGDVYELIIQFAKLLVENKEEIAFWIWQETQADAAHAFLGTAAGILENMTLVLKLLGFVNEQGPFVWDLVLAPKDVTYFLTQTDGMITSMEQNDPPVASLAATPNSGPKPLEVLLDASASTSGRPIVEYRYDFGDGQSYTETTTNNDGNFDGKTTHIYTNASLYTATVTVKDQLEREDSEEVEIHVDDMGISGEIAFTSYRDGSYNIYIINADGSKERKLTTGYNPAWSPDGIKIAFNGNYVINLDGSNLRRLPIPTLTSGDVSVWSPDGTKITVDVQAYQPSDIFIVGEDGTNLRNLTNSPNLGEWHPSWSPDGSMIAFTTNRNVDWEIFIINIDGSNLRNLTNTHDSDELRPSWSPTGTQIAYLIENSGRDIHLINADGTNPVNLTNDLNTYVGTFAWSPDGTRIVFNASVSRSDLYIINSDGTNQKRLTDTNDADDVFPHWSPDGSKIAFVSRKDGIADLWVMDVNGTNAIRIAFNIWTGDALLFSWSPE